MSTKLILHFERLLNRILSMDPDLSAALGELSGRVISLEFINTGFVIYVVPGNGVLSLYDEYEGDVHVRIRATPSDMLAYMMSNQAGTGQFAGSLEIIGDVGLAQRFQAIMKNIDLDWEEQLSQRVGDTAAHKLGRLFKSGLGFIRESKRTLELDISEYLLYEKQVVPDWGEIDQYLKAVDELRNDVERLKSRVEKLQGRLSDA